VCRKRYLETFECVERNSLYSSFRTSSRKFAK